MRLAAWLLVLVLLPTAGAFSLPLPTSGEASAEAAEPPQAGPVVLVRLANEGPATDVWVNLSRDFGAPPEASHQLRLAAGESRDLAVPWPPGEVVVDVTQSEPFLILSASNGDAVALDTTGCDGAFQVPFVVRRGATMRAEPIGCLARPAAFVAMLDEARRAPSRGGPAVHVPRPGRADAGVVLGWGRLAQPDWTRADELRFAWQGGVEAQDSWGRPATRDDAQYVTPYGGSSFAGNSFGLSGESSSFAVTQVFRYAPGASRPEAWSDPRTFAEATFVSASARVETRLRHDDAPDPLACVLRSALQGRDWRAGDEAPLSALCPTWGDDALTLRAGAPESRRGFLAIPLTAWRDDAAGATFVRIWLADGVPYPLDVERYAQPAGLPVAHAAYRLDRLAQEGEPLAAATAAERPSPGGLVAPLDPLHGPALGEGRDRFPFPLDVAVEAARLSPAPPDAQAILADPEAILAAAFLYQEGAEGAPSATRVWELGFVAPGKPPVWVTCQRPASLPAAAPGAACHEHADDVLTYFGFLEIPDMGREDLPVQAATFDAALARWGATSDEGPSALASAAHYVAFDDGDEGARVGVGADLMRTLPQAEAHATGVALRLQDGRTLFESRFVQRDAGLPEVAPGIGGGRALVAPDSAGPLGVLNGPFLVGAGLVTLLLVLAAAAAWLSRGAFAALYTRLARGDVLEADVRRRMMDIVREEPGIHASALLQRLGKEHGVGEYHLGVLVREGYLATLGTPGFRRYFPAGRYSPAQMRALALLRDGRNEEIVEAVRRQPGVRLGELAARVGVSKPYMSRAVKRLVERGVLVAQREGRDLRLDAAPGLALD